VFDNFLTNINEKKNIFSYLRWQDNRTGQSTVEPEYNSMIASTWYTHILTLSSTRIPVGSFKMLKAAPPVPLLVKDYYTVWRAHEKLLNSILAATRLMSNPMEHPAD
jgi:hypothetical protein